MDALPTAIHRFLISTTSRFTDIYASPDLRIDHAWPTWHSPHRIRQGLEEGPYSRNYFVLSMDIEEPEQKTVVIPDYSYLGDQVCVALSILYGKRFDNHGPLVSHGMFQLPDFNQAPPTNYFSAAPYSHRRRKDVSIPLELNHFSRVASLITDECPDEKFIRILFAAGRFYLRSLQVFDLEPEFAYLDMVTCGEILSNYYGYPASELLDEDTRKAFERIRAEMQAGNSIVSRLQGRMRQIRRAYTRTLLALLTTTFFENSECTAEFGRLEKSNIEGRLKASYDLRSQYVHTGIRFGRWTHPHGAFLNEVQIGKPLIGNKELEKTISLAPTYFGMERIMRYCLLRFIHLKGVRIDPALDGAGVSTEETSGPGR